MGRNAKSVKMLELNNDNLMINNIKFFHGCNKVTLQYLTCFFLLSSLYSFSAPSRVPITFSFTLFFNNFCVSREGNIRGDMIRDLKTRGGEGEIVM